MFIDLTQIKKSWDMLWGVSHSVNEQNCIIIKTKTTYRKYNNTENKKREYFSQSYAQKNGLTFTTLFPVWSLDWGMYDAGKRKNDRSIWLTILRILFTRKDWCWLSYLTKKAFLVTLDKMYNGKPLHSLCISGNGSQYKVTSRLYQQLSSYDVGIPHLQGFHLFLDMWTERYDFLAPYCPNYRT